MATAETRREAATALTESALELVRERFGTAKEPLEGFDFHNEGHSKQVVDRAGKILEAMRRGGINLSKVDIAIGKLIAAWHDSKQNWEPKTDWPAGSDDAKFGRVFRKRFVEKNESESAEEVLQLMRSMNEHGDEILFTDTDMERAQAAIMGTVPGWDVTNKTVKQPIIHAESDPITRAVALADLGEAGMDHEGYLEGSFRLFREEHLDMRDLDPSTFQDGQEAYYIKRMQGWMDLQVGFAEGRKARFAEESEGLPKQVTDLFKDFDVSIEEARKRAEITRKESFAELYKRFGYKTAQERAAT